MCRYKIKTGIKVLGRNVYRTDTGVKIGWTGPTVSLESALSELSLPLSQALRDACDAIDLRIASEQIHEAEMLGSPWERDEQGSSALSMSPPDVACREDERQEEEYTEEQETADANALGEKLERWEAEHGTLENCPF